LAPQFARSPRIVLSLRDTLEKLPATGTLINSWEHECVRAICAQADHLDKEETASQKSSASDEVGTQDTNSGKVSQ
jgi:hypothetical protein